MWNAQIVSGIRKFMRILLKIAESAYKLRIPLTILERINLRNPFTFTKISARNPWEILQVESTYILNYV